MLKRYLQFTVNTSRRKSPLNVACPLLMSSESKYEIFFCFTPTLLPRRMARIIGYAYAHRHMQREAYQWNAELSIYLDQKATSKGIGTEPAKKIIAILKLQGLQKVCSGITQPNHKSNGLHEKLGGYLVGTYRNAGFKAGRWYDVSWFQKDIGKHLPQPEKPISLCELKHEQIDLILSTPML